MQEKMSWNQIVKKFPDEWVALTDYDRKDPESIEGVVIAHHPNRQQFHQTVGDLLENYKILAIRYTGDLIKNPEIPLLWQISHTE